MKFTTIITMTDTGMSIRMEDMDTKTCVEITESETQKAEHGSLMESVKNVSIRMIEIYKQVCNK